MQQKSLDVMSHNPADSHLSTEEGAVNDLPGLLVAHRDGASRTVPDGTLGQVHELWWYGAFLDDRVAPFIEGDGLGKKLGAVAVGLAGHWVDRDPQFTHLTHQLTVENGGW